MTIELTAEQAETVANNGDEVVVIDPRTKQSYRLVREDVFAKVRGLLYDDSPWTLSEAALLAGIAFGKLDDTDYSAYLENP